MVTDEQGDGLKPWSPAVYRIEVEGRLADSFEDWFGGMRITIRERADGSVVTCLEGAVTDQAALTGMLNGLAEIHLPILAVQRIGEGDESTDESGPPNS